MDALIDVDLWACTHRDRGDVRELAVLHLCRSGRLALLEFNQLSRELAGDLVRDVKDLRRLSLARGNDARWLFK